jgi:phosphate transport system substrate-binding protein
MSIRIGKYKFGPGAIVLAVAVLLGCIYVAASQFGILDKLMSKTGGSTELKDGRVSTDTKSSLRIHGSNTIGAKLAPELAKAFLESQGAKDAKILDSNNAEEKTVEGTVNGSKQIIEIEAHDSDTAFVNLGKGECDIGMSSRKIKQEETDKLKSLGDMEDSSSEKVLAYDGIAVIVNKNNETDKLTKEQVRKIFAGEITDWKDVSKTKSGKIKVYAREQGSGTLDFFTETIGLKDKIINSAERISDSTDLSKKVSSDDNGIGFIGLPYILQSKALALSDGDSTALLPTAFTVATQDYLLSRQLYLYVPQSSKNSVATKFIEFALSKDGRKIVTEQKLVSLDVAAKKDKDSSVSDENVPDAYKKLTAGTTRSNVNIRFKSGASKLDNASLQRIDIIMESLEPNQKVLLIGFGDNQGDEETTLKISRDRAKTVMEAFKQRGVKIEATEGFGSARPVGSNETEEGREKNRRVEVWIK